MLYLLPLVILVYLVSQDRNVADYIYLKVFKEFPLAIKMSWMKYTMLIQLRIDTYRMKRGHIPRKFMDMAKEMRKDL